MASWVLLLVVVVGEQWDRFQQPPSWRTVLIAVALLLGYAGEQAWWKRDLAAQY